MTRFARLGALRPHHLSCGLVAVLVGYTSSAAIIFQAAATIGATPQQLGCWLSALGLGMGLTTCLLSWRYRMPILTAWSTPGAALLITSLQGATMSEAIGAFLLSSLFITLCGVTGLFARLMHRLPLHLANAMLAGVLLRFGLDLFHALQAQPWLVGVMIVAFCLLKPHLPRYTLALVLLLGIAIAWQEGLLQPQSLTFTAVEWSWTTPTFSWHALLGIALPLFLVTMSSQNLPGVAILQAHGHHPPISPLISWTGLAGLLLAPFGGYALNLAAITAALCMGKEADPEPERRYLAACCAGLLYLLTALLGATVANLFSALPTELILAIAGLALLGALGNSLHQALAHEKDREAAIVTFLVTASGLSWFGIGSAFWGLGAGALALVFKHAGERWHKPASKKPSSRSEYKPRDQG